MSRPLLLAANWKMNKTAAQAAEFVKDYAARLPESAVPTVLLPPFTAIPAVASACKSSGKPETELAFGAQNYYFEGSGAFTGEVSAEMLLEWGCRYVICGHSERRQIFGETDDLISKKVARAIEAGMIPIFCIGETLYQRESGKLLQILARQVDVGLQDAKHVDNLIVAYEPVWAIGTGVVATPDQAQTAHKYVRDILKKKIGARAEFTLILYGGSVKADNIASLVSLPDIDGVLVGGASLEVESLLKLHAACVSATDNK